MNAYHPKDSKLLEIYYAKESRFQESSFTLDDIKMAQWQYNKRLAENKNKNRGSTQGQPVSLTKQMIVINLQYKARIGSMFNKSRQNCNITGSRTDQYRNVLMCKGI